MHYNYFINYQIIRNKMHHQDNIKNHLRLIDLEENEEHRLNSRHLYDLHQQVKISNSCEHDITDWMNSQRSINLIKAAKKQINSSLQDYKKILAFDSTRYQSSLLSKTSSKIKRIQLSPLAIKFNAKQLSKNLQRSRQDFLQRLRQDPYLTHYKSMSSRRNCESLKLKQFQILLDEKQPNKQQQRSFGLLYLLKRRDFQKNGKRRNQPNPQDLTVCHCKMF